MTDRRDGHKPPNTLLAGLMGTLRPFTGAIAVVRGDGWAANLCGQLVIAPDGADPYAVRLQQCGCHLHVDWERAVRFTYHDEDVGYGPEPMVALRDAGGTALVRLFYQPQDRDRLRAALRNLVTDLRAAGSA
ncbi:hypothetical protein QFZ82_002176 [Streptomyces sp. V4I23]|uniref:hypothetical protein n=1 Tax=Streptomyces sp. V4I23 TaxID=3042282 RepID=UPI00278302F1|nr:hypothetical protein [Streptomyces sp. V4I23]MDQ1007691.1 hypothetical protein [Streptomyces sp. V4I23]